MGCRSLLVRVASTSLYDQLILDNGVTQTGILCRWEGEAEFWTAVTGIAGSLLIILNGCHGLARPGESF
ncbi:uncharacterized protein BDZ83DRAFT_143861 [Colletotrichum acutatum]|uniref:Uncharacterized protein n=1 Tax=Glomerella acutata TaxID=27357 RepID=A0AAD8XC87_GLOAC|nr:uncharacterized protein BDZ83DRAFT_143861 [Colletotrichum acutatum]KAK1709436.1 hypothetical protein BDZ83DRAFT_143861 [Colletotrichum acutatum]